LAKGGFAMVWQARQEALDRHVAIKVDERPLNTEVERRRFLGEARMAGNLSGHPGIVTVHDAGILEDGRPYLCGEAFTAADLAFAALAAPVVLPREYGVPLPAVEELPPDMAAAVRAFRAHPAGAFACRLFAEER